MLVWGHFFLPFVQLLNCTLMFLSAGNTHTNILRYMHTHITNIHIHLYRQVSHPLQLQLWPTSTGVSLFMYVWMPEREKSRRALKKKTGSWGAIRISIACHVVSSLSSHVEPSLPAERQGGLISFLPCWMMQCCMQLWACPSLNFRVKKNWEHKLLLARLQNKDFCNAEFCS